METFDKCRLFMAVSVLTSDESVQTKPKVKFLKIWRVQK